MAWRPFATVLAAGRYTRALSSSSAAALAMPTNYVSRCSFKMKVPNNSSMRHSRENRMWLCTCKCDQKSPEDVAKVTSVCWNCQANLTNDPGHLYCTNCQALKSPPTEPIDHFALMGMDKSFKVDLRKLSERYKELQRQLHPDRFANKSEEERNLSDTWSPMVNEAYTTLLKPVKRANYLLELAGNPLEEGDIHLDANFLAEVMELNEEIADAETHADVAGLVDHVRQVLQRYYNHVEKVFAAGDVAAAKLIVAKMQYYNNIKDKLKEKETRMGIIH